VHSFYWKQLPDQPALHRYEQHLSGPQINPEATPVLFLQPLPPETGNPLAELFREDGFTAIYAYTVTHTNTEAALALGETIDWLLAQHPNGEQRVVMVGCASGGLLGRRYLMLGGTQHVAYLFTLGSAHNYSQLAYLRGTIFEGRAGADEPPPVAAPMDHTVLVNIYSELKRRTPGEVVHLPDAVNVALPLGEEALCRDRLTYEEIRRYMQGALWLVTVRLQKLIMRGGAMADDLTGPFCFEINGWRAPFDGVFRVPVDSPFEFDPTRTRLGTLTFPLTASGYAVDIDFRLKDLTSRLETRRKLLTSLHTPLRAGLMSEHVLQDSLGSEVCIQVRCDQPKPVLDSDHG
jgi:hypothetical protein